MAVLLRDSVAPVTWLGQWAVLVPGIVLMALGVAIYLQSKIAPNPMDRSMLVVSNLTGWNVSYSRAAISIVLVIVGFMFNGAIGIGTLINAVISGVLINFFIPYVKCSNPDPVKAEKDWLPDRTAF